MQRNFDEWLSTFKSSISNYDYYTNFEKVYANVERVKIELNILNSLIGSQKIESDFLNILNKYPEVKKCIPILLAVRSYEIFAMDENGEFKYNFIKPNQTKEQYCIFMRKTGLFNLFEKHIISNVIDYVTGVETGLDSNARKNRGGHLMENLVESYLVKAGFIESKDYFKEIDTKTISGAWNVDLSSISNQGRSQKRFDFVVKTDKTIYLIETNFYASPGSKLNETARSYKNIALDLQNIDSVEFVWFTDGFGWNSAKNNLEETFGVMKHLYCIEDMKNGIIEKVFI